MAINSRQKGARNERLLAQLLRENGFENARRGQQYSGINGDADVIGLPGVHIEAKAVERLNIHEAMAQSVRDARGMELPTVFHKKNRTGWLVTMRFEEWLLLYNLSGLGRESDE
jgi:Holliday junction resolvase